MEGVLDGTAGAALLMGAELGLSLATGAALEAGVAGVSAPVSGEASAEDEDEPPKIAGPGP